MLRVVILILAILLAACNRQPLWFPPPEQRHFIEPPDVPARIITNMSDGDAADHIAGDILPYLPGNTWCWTQKRPAVRFLLANTAGLKFVTDFAIAEATMKQTGPVTISFYVGNNLLDKVRYDVSGSKHFEKPVNPDWLQTTAETVVSAEIDKLYIAPLDGAKLGFILTRMGFEHQ